MTSKNSALAHLTATYTDSENEDEFYEIENQKEETSNPDLNDVPMISVAGEMKPNLSLNKKKGTLRLVNYHDDTVVSDDDEVLAQSIEINENSQVEPATIQSEPISEPEEKKLNLKFAQYGFSLPSEPKGKPNAELISKIQHLYTKMDTSNVDMNKIIQERKEFRNPSIYEKLIQFCDINEFGTNYPIEIYDPLQWGTESFYEELAKVQKNEMLKRQKERKENDKVEQAAAAARKVEEEAKKRKSKWDQPAISTVVKSTIALTASVTGTKGTVISAFGSLPKKLG